MSATPSLLTPWSSSTASRSSIGVSPRLEAGCSRAPYPFAGTLDVSGVCDAFFFDTTTGVPALKSRRGRDIPRRGATRSSTAAVLRPRVEAATPYVLKRETNQAEYILLGPHELLDVAQPLLDQRTAQGLPTQQTDKKKT